LLHKVLRDIPYATVRVNPGQYTGVCIRKVASGATRVRRWRTVDVGRPAGESDRPEPDPPADDHHVLPSYPLIWAGLLFSRRNLCLRVFGNPVRVSKTYSALRDTETAWTEAAEDVAQTYDRPWRVLALIESALGVDEAVSVAKAARSDWHLEPPARVRGCTQRPFASDPPVSQDRTERRGHVVINRTPERR
jgi:hypothetical protein